jgi:photosystem II stability/assembly factor-like uncharacterized protein
MNNINNSPNKPENRPGLAKLSYRISDYAGFRQRLLSLLSTILRPEDGSKKNGPLAKLTSILEDDPAIAILDAWAVVADVLTFYQERIANEGYLRTATERLSLIELAQTIGYKLNPGVAASTYLAFTVEDTPNSPKVAIVPKGTQIMSVPIKDELPQTFETSADFTAYAEFNAIKPRLSRPQVITKSTYQLYLNKINAQLQIGDWLLLVDESLKLQIIDESPKLQMYLLHLTKVEENREAGYTLVQWQEYLPTINTIVRNPKVFAFRQKAFLFGNNAPKWSDMPVEIKLAAIEKKGDSIQGGVFGSNDNGNTWLPVSKGLPNEDILCLAIQDNIIFAGTPNKGIFRSTDNGENWQASNNGLTNLSIQTLYADGQNLFAGTPGGGVFRSRDRGVNWVSINIGTVRVESQPNSGNPPTNWQSINTSLPNTVVRSLITYPGTPTQLKDITIQSTNTIVTADSDIKFKDFLKVGDAITAAGQTRIVNDIDNKTLRINTSFRTNLPAQTSFFIGGNYIFVGTDDGVFLSADQGKNWESKNLSDKVVYSLLITTDSIKNKIYLFAGTNTGIYRSENLGEDWQSTNSINNDDLSDKTVYSLTNYQQNNTNFIFAGSDSGIYRSLNYGDTWEGVKLVNQGRSLVNYQSGGKQYLLAATNQGIYRSENSDVDSNNIQWGLINEGLSTLEINVLAVNKQNNLLMAGSKFASFLKTENNPTVNIKQEWPSFQIPSATQIDLDTLYPQILPDSWIVLLDDRNLQNPKPSFAATQVQSISTISRSDFGLNAKVSRIEPDQVINPQDFGLRSTTVLARSEELELAPEPLTVSDRQQDIFQDPFPGDIIFLSRFVQKLQANQTLIISGKRIQLQLNDVGGIFFNTKIVSELPWQRRNRGLANSQVRSLAVFQNNVILTGTTEGIFRSPNHGNNWEPIINWQKVNANLNKKDIQALLTLNNLIFVGTAEGIFRSEDGGDYWQDISQNLAYKDIRVIALNQQQIFIGTINGGLFYSENNGDSWLATGLNNTDVQAIAIRQETEIFVGTIKNSIFHSLDRGITWKQLTSTRVGIGTIYSNGAVVKGNRTQFESDLKTGDIINAGEQTRTIINIDNQQLTVDVPFLPDLAPNTSFTINTGLTNSNITSLAIWENYIFAGTAGSGIFRSEDQGNRWKQVNTNLTDLEIRCLTTDGKNVWVGTASGGVFCSDNNGEVWTPINTNLPNTDIRAILINNNDIFVGGIGILRSLDGLYTKTVQRGDILQIITPPKLEPNQPNYQQWQLRDKDNFQGELITTCANDFTLLPAIATSEIVSEVATIQVPPTNQQLPILKLQQPLKYAYDPVTVEIYANVIPATHGVTVVEVLGSGDGNTTNQQFTIKKPPLTYVPAPIASGAASTLELRVNDVLWQEKASLYPLTPQDQSYIIRIEDDGTTIVTFGDGIKGARLPTGQENITATYRSGIGLDGNINAGRLSLLKTRPLGIIDVTNPLATSGAAPSESLEQIRAKAPPTVRTLKRIVSLQDFEDFAQGFAGIGKAQAVALWNSEMQLVHITIAAVNGDEVTPESNLYINLLAAISNARDPIQQVQIDSYERLLFNLEARLLIDERYLPETVELKVHIALQTTFAFEKRAFEQEVTAAEIIAVIQSHQEVIAVDLDALYQLGRSKSLNQVLTALPAHYEPQDNQVHPAQLFLLNPAGIKLTVVKTL